MTPSILDCIELSENCNGQQVFVFNSFKLPTYLRCLRFPLLKWLIHYNSGPPGVLGIWGEWLFIFWDLGSTGYYFRGAGEQAHSLGDLGSPSIKQKKNNGKASILFDFLKFLLLLGG